MSLKEILMGGSGALVVLATLLEVSKIKINPWSSFFRFIGRCINAELIAKVDSMEAKMEKSDEAREKKDAVDIRNRILLFGDEARRGVKHSEEHFNQVLEDITDYELYCSKHPEFPNEKAVITCRRIKEIYEKCLRDKDFL